MGFFSFLTADTQESIPNRYTKRCRDVYLLLPEGNLREGAYDGYGRFCGFDVYALLAERNGLGHDRDAGVKLFYSDAYEYADFQLKFSFDPNANYFELDASTDCPNQGYFYGEIDVGGGLRL